MSAPPIAGRLRSLSGPRIRGPDDRRDPAQKGMNDKSSVGTYSSCSKMFLKSWGLRPKYSRV
jgi:hypothetical protein